MARVRDVEPVSVTAGKKIARLLKESGEKGVVGMKGFIRRSGNAVPGGAVIYIPVKIVGMELDGCTPRLRVDVVGGLGSFFLDSPCQFLGSREEIKEMESREEKALALKRDSDRLNGDYNAPVYLRVARLKQMIEEKVTDCYQHPEIAAELEQDGLSLEDPKFQARHLTKYGDMVLRIVHGTTAAEDIYNDEDE
jgi:hypothetical protein